MVLLCTDKVARIVQVECTSRSMRLLYCYIGMNL